MYLRRIRKEGGYHYVIRESYRHEECWKHRDLMDLGTDPEDYIEYPGENGFYFKWELEEALREQGADYSSEDLEALFLPFLSPHIQRIIGNFRHSQPHHAYWSTRSSEELFQHQQELHPLDKRRLHYLRCGRVDIGNLEGRSWKFLNVLLGKSRDEIEHTIEEMERQLSPREIRPYLFTAFHLQAYFPHHLLRNQPAALDPERVDSYFMEEICRLNRSSHFFRGVEDHDGECLHPYLTKYLILYFDHDFDHRSLWNEYIEEFIRQRQFYQRSPVRPPMEIQEACERLGITAKEFEGMTRKELVRRYRRRAKTMHPDKGGDHEAFVCMTEAYECLLIKKK